MQKLAPENYFKKVIYLQNQGVSQLDIYSKLLYPMIYG